MKKTVFAAMTVLSLPVFLSACGLFEQNGDNKTLPPKTQSSAVEPSVPEAKAATVETLSAPAPEVKATATPKQETLSAPAPEVKATATPKQEALSAPAPEVKAADSSKKQETVAASAPEKIQLPCTYVVKTNDSLWRLAVEYYGKGAKWTLILDANKDKIKNPDHLEPGTELTIPAPAAPSQNQ